MFPGVMLTVCQIPSFRTFLLTHTLDWQGHCNSGGSPIAIPRSLGILSIQLAQRDGSEKPGSLLPTLLGASATSLSLRRNT